MKVLVLGNSDTQGQRTGGESWTTLAADLVRQDLGEEVEVVDTTFLPVGSGAAAVAQRRVDRHRPDVVLLPVSEWPFVHGFVWLRVRRLLGTRAGEWARRLEERLDGAAGRRRLVPRGIYRAARWLAHRVPGTECLATHEESSEAVLGTLAVLSRVEHIRVITLRYAPVRVVGRVGDSAEQRAEFFASIGRVAEQHRFECLDAEALLTGLGQPLGEYFLDDGLHTSSAGHRVLAPFVAAALATALREVGPEP